MNNAPTFIPDKIEIHRRSPIKNATPPEYCHMPPRNGDFTIAAAEHECLCVYLTRGRGTLQLEAHLRYVSGTFLYWMRVTRSVAEGVRQI